MIISPDSRQAVTAFVLSGQLDVPYRELRKDCTWKGVVYSLGNNESIEQMSL